MTAKTCTKCRATKPETEFHRAKRGNGGRAAQCKVCRAVSARAWYDLNKERAAATSKRWAEANRERMCEATQRYRDVNPDKVNAQKLAYKKNNPTKAVEYSREYRRLNPDSVCACNAAWAKANRSKRTAYENRRRAAKLDRTPPWLTDDHLAQIEQVYAHAKECEVLTGGKYHVDHIIPLQGATVSGLHVPWNLQVLPADVNCSKYNKFEELAE